MQLQNIAFQPSLQWLESNYGLMLPSEPDASAKTRYEFVFELLPCFL
jgi:hypothetical protein